VLSPGGAYDGAGTAYSWLKMLENAPAITGTYARTAVKNIPAIKATAVRCRAVLGLPRWIRLAVVPRVSFIIFIALAVLGFDFSD